MTEFETQRREPVRAHRGRRPFNRLWRPVGVVLAVAALSLTGCSADGADQGDGAAAKLVVGNTYPPVNLDPAQATGLAMTLPYLSPVYDRLIETDTDGELAPGLATSWTMADDGSSLELELRTGVTFADGTAFDAEAVKANLERYMNEAGPYVQDMVSAIASVEVVDPQKVRLNLVEGEGADLAYNLSSLPGFMISPAAFENADLDVNPVGTGPYTLAPGGFASGQSAKYVRKDEYWAGEDVYRSPELELIGYTDTNAGLNALTNGQIDMFVGKPNQRFDQVSADPSLAVELSPTGGYYQIRLNMKGGPLSDVRVRQALSYALDREALAEGITGSKQGCTANAQPLPTGPGHLDELDDAYPHDPEKARALLAEAGYPEVTLTGLFIPSDPPSNAFAQMTQAMLNEVGVTVDFTATTIPQFVESWSAADSDLSPSSTTLQYRGNILSRYIKDPTLLGTAPQAVLDAAEGYTDPSLSEEERTKVWEEINRSIVEEVSGALIVCHSSVAVIANKSVSGIDKIPSMHAGSYDVKNLVNEE